LLGVLQQRIGADPAGPEFEPLAAFVREHGRLFEDVEVQHAGDTVTVRAFGLEGRSPSSSRISRVGEP
jgi:hypothetical protein